MEYQPEIRNDEIILIADDNEQTSLYIRALLEDSGFTCVTADNGFKTVQIVQSQRVDLVLLDIVMPDINGFTIASKIKSFSKEFLPVIMVTALCGVDDKITGLSYADDYITKPFSGDELIARIKSLLRNRRLHNELSQSKERFESLYENFPHLYISLDSDKKITDCNRFYRQTFNVTKAEIIGRTIFEFIVEEEHAILEHFINSLQQHAAVKQRIFRLARNVQSKETVFVSLKAVYIGDQGTGLWFVIAMEDVTQQLKIQEEQKIARKQLYKSARLASIGTLASGVAHEMNNPLTAILGFSSAIMDRVANHEIMEQSELEQYLQIINMEALRCRDIVENLSRFAREGGEYMSASVSTLECSNNAIKLIHAKLVKSKMFIDNSLGDDCMVAGDATKIEQVFVNILTNCIDFCDQGSVVKMTTTTSRDDSRFYSISISDNGPGIPSDILPKVFDPFFTTKQVGQGTGMGLAICHRIMEELNGSIDITSDRDHGTTVVLEFVKKLVEIKREIDGTTA